MPTSLVGIDWLQKLDIAASPAEIAAQAAEIDALQADDEVAASATASGRVELATDAEALLGTDAVRAVTPANLKHVNDMRDVISFMGCNLAGACTATGLKVGDVVLSVTGLASGTVGDQSEKFESTITIADQIQQSQASDLSTNVYMALVQRKS